MRRDIRIRTAIGAALLALGAVRTLAQAPPEPPPEPPEPPKPESSISEILRGIREANQLYEIPAGKTVRGSQTRFGNEVRIDGTLEGTLKSLAAETRVSGTVTRDLVVTGKTLYLDGTVGDDLTFFGDLVEIRGKVRGDLVLTGRKVVIGKDAVISGDATVNAQEMDIDGTFERDLDATGGILHLGADVHGDAEVNVGEFRPDAGAHIAGNLKYDAPNEIGVDLGTIVEGSVTHDGSSEQEPKPRHPRVIRIDEPSGTGAVIGAFFGSFVGYFLFLSFFYVIVRPFVPRAVSAIRTEGLQCMGVGFLGFLTPFAAILAAILIVTIPLVIVVWLIYPFALLAGTVPAFVILGQLALRPLRPDAKPGFGAFVLGLALFWIAIWILFAWVSVVVGIFTIVFGVLLGLGALILGIRDWREARKKRLAATSAATA